MRFITMEHAARGLVPVLERDGTYYDLTELSAKASEAGILPHGYPVSLDTVFRYGDPWAWEQLVREQYRELPTLELHPDAPLAPPVRDGDIICVGRSYAEHARELGNEVPDRPLLFMKPRSSLIGHNHTVFLPADTIHAEYEGELVLVIGKPLYGEVSAEEAASAVWGLTLMNDITDRGMQGKLKEKGKPWLAAKGRPGFAPLGPAVFPVRELECSIDDLTLSLSVNGKRRQTGSPAQWLWPLGELVRSIAAITGLAAGSLIATGTPKGVGELKSGDHVEIKAEHVGILAHDVKMQS
ncbi:2-hydroxyhepta-2,4-diene-1,7-dioate isomerase [bacterium]|nr:2-hydroxyhepta-2,4-diene-1,7-dioate isomerase [bacterium]